MSYAPLKYSMSKTNSLVNRPILFLNVEYHDNNLEFSRVTFLTNLFIIKLINNTIYERNLFNNTIDIITNSTITDILSKRFKCSISIKVRFCYGKFLEHHIVSMLKPFKLVPSWHYFYFISCLFLKLKDTDDKSLNSGLVYVINYLKCSSKCFGEAIQYLHKFLCKLPHPTRQKHCWQSSLCQY